MLFAWKHNNFRGLFVDIGAVENLFEHIHQEQFVACLIGQNPHRNCVLPFSFGRQDIFDFFETHVFHTHFADGSVSTKPHDEVSLIREVRISEMIRS